jgi:nucleotide-binding universal stress UspA family protein
VKEIIAALDNSLAAKPVLTTALALGDLLGAQVIPVHVSLDGARVAAGTAENAGLKLQVRRGPIVEQLFDQARGEEVVALVLGTHGSPGDRRPLGSTAVAIATSVQKPVVVVPPDARTPGALRRVLIPIERGVSASLTPQAIIELAQGAELDVVVLHVHEPTALPAFTDQPQHEQSEWTREFVRRYCPWGIGAVRLEVRIGSADEVVPRFAEQERADIIAFGWAQELAEGRAPIIRATLSRGKVPVMLVPVDVPILDVARISEEESWSSLRSSRV